MHKGILIVEDKSGANESWSWRIRLPNMLVTMGTDCLFTEQEAIRDAKNVATILKIDLRDFFCEIPGCTTAALYEIDYQIQDGEKNRNTKRVCQECLPKVIGTGQYAIRRIEREEAKSIHIHKEPEMRNEED